MNAVIEEVAKILVAIGPTIFQDIQAAIPLAQNIVSVVKQPDQQITQAQWDAIHQQIDDLTADIEKPL